MSLPETERAISAAEERVVGEHGLGHGAVERAVRADFEREISWRAARGLRSVADLNSRDGAREIVQGRDRSVVTLALRDQGSGLGLRLDQHREFKRLYGELVSGGADRAALARAAEIVKESPAVARELDSRSAAVARDLGIPAAEARSAMDARLGEAVSRSIEARVEHERSAAAGPSLARDREDELKRDAGSIGLGLSQLASAVAKGAFSERRDTRDDRPHRSHERKR